jgi:hypothetical protein
MSDGASLSLLGVASLLVYLAAGSTHNDWAAHLGCPGEVGNEPGAHRVVPTIATAGPRMRSL